MLNNSSLNGAVFLTIYLKITFMIIATSDYERFFCDNGSHKRGFNMMTKHIFFDLQLVTISTENLHTHFKDNV